MAKESMKAREVKEKKCVERYAEKSSLKSSWRLHWITKASRNASPVRKHNRCKITGRPKGYMRQFGISE